MGPYVPSPKFLTTSGDPGRVIHQILDMRIYSLFFKKRFMVGVRFELKTNYPWSVDDTICEGDRAETQEYPLPGLPTMLVLGDYSL